MTVYVTKVPFNNEKSYMNNNIMKSKHSNVNLHLPYHFVYVICTVLLVSDEKRMWFIMLAESSVYESLMANNDETFTGKQLWSTKTEKVISVV